MDFTYIIKDIKIESCMMYPTKETTESHEAIIYDLFKYSDKIKGYVNHESETSFRYVELELIIYFLD